MQPPPQEISTCPTCGGALEKTSGGGLGCMVCLLRVGIWGEDDMPPDFGSDEHFGVYEIERRPDGSLDELGRGLIADTTPPFGLYLANFNHIQLLWNPFIANKYRDRYYQFCIPLDQ